MNTLHPKKQPNAVLRELSFNSLSVLRIAKACHNDPTTDPGRGKWNSFRRSYSETDHAPFCNSIRQSPPFSISLSFSFFLKLISMWNELKFTVHLGTDNTCIVLAANFFFFHSLQEFTLATRIIITENQKCSTNELILNGHHPNEGGHDLRTLFLPGLASPVTMSHCASSQLTLPLTDPRCQRLSGLVDHDMWVNSFHSCAIELY